MIKFYFLKRKSHHYSRFFTTWFKFLRHLVAKFPSSNLSWFYCLLILFTASFGIFTLNRENNKPYGKTILNVESSMFLEPWIILNIYYLKASFKYWPFIHCVYTISIMLIFTYMLDVLHVLFLIYITSYRSWFSKFIFPVRKLRLGKIRSVQSLHLVSNERLGSKPEPVWLRSTCSLIFYCLCLL